MLLPLLLLLVRIHTGVTVLRQRFLSCSGNGCCQLIGYKACECVCVSVCELVCVCCLLVQSNIVKYELV